MRKKGAEIRKRWLTPDAQGLGDEVFARPLSSKSLQGLPLSVHRGRIDLRGISAPLPRRLRWLGEDGAIREVSAVSGPTGHSEQKILDQLKEGDKILELYSERQPCPDICGPLLRNDPRASGAKITYSVPWVSSKVPGARSINGGYKRLLKQMIDRARG